MNKEIALENMIRQQIRPCEVLDPTVLNLLSVVRREDFVPPEYADLAYADTEIPVGKESGQVLFPPKISARILQDLAIAKSDKVLEIGAGSGYMAALLAALCDTVFTVEVDAKLVDFARANLARQSIKNVYVDCGDGLAGWALYAPYDAIILSGGIKKVPEILLNQLKIGGRIAAIVGASPMMQVQIITRVEEKSWSTQKLFET